MQRSHHPGLAGRRPERTAGPNSETQARSYLLETRRGTLTRPEQHTGSVQGRGTCPPRGTPGHRSGLPGWLHFGFEGIHAVPVPTLGGPTSHRSDGPPLNVVQVSTCAHVAPELPLQTAHTPGCSLPAGRPWAGSVTGPWVRMGPPFRPAGLGRAGQGRLDGGAMAGSAQGQQGTLRPGPASLVSGVHRLRWGGRRLPQGLHPKESGTRAG